MKNKPIRHGEVVLHPTDAARPKQATTKPSIIVGHSETGHHHVLEATKPKTLVYWTDKETHDQLVQLAAPGRLVHQKEVNRHNDLTVAPGTYRVRRKSEYDPFSKVRREVWD